MVSTAGYSSASPEKMTLPELWGLWYVSQHWKTNRLTSTNLQYYYVFLPAAYEMQSELLEANYISYTILLAWKPSYKFLNRLVLLNLYVRDTDSRCKNTKFIVNKRIMLVIFLMFFCKNQHFFWDDFGWNLISLWLNGSSLFFRIFYVEIQKIGSNWFILSWPSFFSSLYKRCNTDIIVKTDQADYKSAK